MEASMERRQWWKWSSQFSPKASVVHANIAKGCQQRTNEHRSHLKGALIRGTICSLENYKQGRRADMRGRD